MIVKLITMYVGIHNTIKFNYIQLATKALCKTAKIMSIL